MDASAQIPQNLRQLLAQTGLLTGTQIEELLKMPRVPGESLVTMLVKSGAVVEEKLLQELAKALHLSFTKIADSEIDDAVRTRVPTKVVFQYNVMPMRADNGTLVVVANDPFNLAMLESIRLVAKCRVQLALSTEADIAKALKRYYGVGAETLDELIQKNVVDLDAQQQITKEDLESGDQEASVVKFVNQIIWEAFKERSTDIHLEPMENDLRIRYRVAGVLHQTPVRAQLMRSSIFLGLDTLGLNQDDEKIVRKLVDYPHGIILVTGPTGSGKSTSLYAFLSTINSIDQRIITIEEPIEYELPGVNQISVKPDIGLTFASGLRHILRQDPDVIMVGEIRDKETDFADR